MYIFSNNKWFQIFSKANGDNTFNKLYDLFLKLSFVDTLKIHTEQHIPQYTEHTWRKKMQWCCVGKSWPVEWTFQKASPEEAGQLEKRKGDYQRLYI